MGHRGLNTASEIAAQLARDVRGVCAYLLPQGREKSGEWCVGSINGEPGESLKVAIKGNRAGRWADFAESGMSGDLLDLWAATRGQTLPQAIEDACDYLGIRKPDFAGSKEVAPAKIRPPQGVQAVDAESDAWAWLTDTRRIPEAVLREYRIAQRGGDTVALPAFSPDGSVQYIKYRSANEKKFWSEKGGHPCLFGWQAVPDHARSVVVCEGELDALAWAAYGYTALSPTNGAGNSQWIDAEFDRLARFDTIYLSFDNDDEGRQGTLDAVERLGRERCHIVELPAKDIGECLMQGTSADVIDRAIEQARTMDPDELRSAAEYADEVVALFCDQGEEPGVRLPWRKAGDRLIFRPGELTILAGVNGHGKSQMAGHITLEAMAQGWRACVASMEFKPPRWIARLTRQASAMAKPSEGYIRAIAGWYDGRLWAFDTTGHAKANRILEVMDYAARRYGVRWFVVDNLAKCGFAEDDYDGQKRFADELSDFAKEHDCHVILVAHMRKGQDDSKPETKMAVKGSGGMTDMADSVLVCWRNRKKEKDRKLAEKAAEHGAESEFDETDEPDARLICEKQRNADEEPSFKLWFDFESNQFIANYGDRPRRYVQWSGATPSGEIESVPMGEEAA